MRERMDAMGAIGVNGKFEQPRQAPARIAPLIDRVPLPRLACTAAYRQRALEQVSIMPHVLRYRKRPRATVSRVKLVKRQMAVRAGKARCDLSASVLRTLRRRCVFREYIDSAHDPFDEC